MDIDKIKLLLNTVKYLKPIQVYYRLYYFFKNRVFNIGIGEKPVPVINPIIWKNKLNSYSSYLHKKKSFTFLNITHHFSGQIDWNYSKNGKLWTYNLNYFDFLNQGNISKETGILLIRDFIKNEDLSKDGKEPYPISIRGMNWVKFLAGNSIKDTSIDKTLYKHYRLLNKNIEYHLLGNHLLENSFSLLFGAYYFQDEELYNKSKNLLKSELNEQVLKDGAHYELSPMYHQILFSRLLDCINLIKLNSSWKMDNLISFLEQKASLMLSWLQNVTYSNGDIPMVNDSTYDIAPKSLDLFDYSLLLGIQNRILPLSESGYRKIVRHNFELFVDIGNIGPDYQPGHSHSDTFSFELYKNNSPIFVDTGVSTYKKDDIRQKERSTASHNTVMLGKTDQTEVWGGFRVARRAKVFDLQTGFNLLSAKHSGYKKIGYIHSRSYEWFDNKIIIKDSLSKPSRNNAKAFFHFHSSINLPQIKNSTLQIDSLGVIINFENASEIFIDEYKLSKGFNKSVLAYKLVVTFDHYLKTIIKFK